MDSKVTQIDKRKIWRVGVIAIMLSVTANLIIFFLLRAILDLPSATDFPPLSAPAIGFMTAVFTFLGVLVFAIIVRLSANPIRTFWIVATIAFIISILPNIGAALNPESAPFPFPVSSGFGYWILILFHLVAYLITTILLTTKTAMDE